MGDKCGSHTFPYIEVKNNSSQVEHEATTSKIGEDQLFYCNQRGIGTEEAIALIVNGYCKDVLNQLPMEFAVEAQKLLEISLEGSVDKNIIMLKIKNLNAGIEETKILKGINLEINAGEIHAIMGPNGSGKSTLSSVIAGDENYEVESGSIMLNGEDLLEMDPDERAHKGVFLSFQYPVEIPGISVSNFMKAAINEKRKNLGQDPISAKDLLHKMKEKKWNC